MHVTIHALASVGSSTYREQHKMGALVGPSLPLCDMRPLVPAAAAAAAKQHAIPSLIVVRSLSHQPVKT